MIQSAKYVIHIFCLLAANCCHDLWKVAMFRAVYALILSCSSYFQGFLMVDENNVGSSERIISVSVK